jgi:hypothetical protein
MSIRNSAASRRIHDVLQGACLFFPGRMGLGRSCHLQIFLFFSFQEMAG